MIRNAIRAAVLALALIGAPAAADYEAGQRAWDAGAFAEALSAWQAAAEAGDSRSMLALGRRHAQGLGAVQDYVEAHKWLNLAASLGEAAAAVERDALAAKMTPQQVAAAQARAAAWQPGEAAARRWQGQVGTRFRDCDECPELVVVSAGSFKMGSPESEAEGFFWERPVHWVTIERPFAMGVHEVTRGEYSRFVSATDYSRGNSCRTYEGGDWQLRSDRDWRSPGYQQADAHPVVCVNWDDAKAYVRWLSEKTGKAYRLPSESEWEYAARGGTETARYWGESASKQCRYENGGDRQFKKRYSQLRERYSQLKERYIDWRWVVSMVADCDDGYAYTSPAGSFGSNGFGLHDVLGNVREWVEDCLNDSYLGAPRDESVWESGECSSRVLRGGAWNYRPGVLRSATRHWKDAGLRDAGAGFRVARTLTP